MKKIILFFIAVLFFVSCKKETSLPTPTICVFNLLPARHIKTEKSIILTGSQVGITVHLSFATIGTTGPYKVYRNNVFLAYTSGLEYTDGTVAAGQDYSYQIGSSDSRTVYSNIWTIHIKPPISSSVPVILLDFDGATWNGTTYLPSGFNSDQISFITDSVRRSFSFANFTVTTDESVYNAADVYKRERVIMTQTAWYAGASGVAYEGSFVAGTDTPCWVFSEVLYYDLGYNIKVAVHELGHTLWVYHTGDCYVTRNGITMSDWMSQCFGVAGYFGQPTITEGVYEQTIIKQTVGQ